MQTPNAPDETSWWDDLIGGLSQKQVPPPPTPQPPPVDQSAWGKSVEQAKISDSLGSVHDLGLIIFNETRSYTDRPDSIEPLDIAREKIGHSIMPIKNTASIAWVTPRLPCPSSRQRAH